MKRLYQKIFLDHLADLRQMIFVMGPRQSGKTTVAQNIISSNSPASYISWDNTQDRALLLNGTDAIASKLGLVAHLQGKQPIVCFDEIHKYAHWRDLLKGFYDSYPDQSRVLVTGSAKLDVFSRGGDSLMGRYFPFRFHPFSVAEVVRGQFLTNNISNPQNISDDLFESLWRFGGYPDPFIKQSDRFHRRWQKLRMQQLFQEDIRDLTRVQDVARLQLMAEYMRLNATSQVTYSTLSKHLRITDKTVREWLTLLKSLYFCFDIKPYSTNVARSLLKEPKYYLWDWSLCMDDGVRAENFVAMALLKAVHFWNDMGLGDYDLCYLRDKEKREVDFVVVKDQKPWILVEVKLKNSSHLSPHLQYFQKQLQADYALQVVFEMDYIDRSCFVGPDPIIVPAKTFLSQLI